MELEIAEFIDTCFPQLRNQPLRIYAPVGKIIGYGSICSRLSVTTEFAGVITEDACLTFQEAAGRGTIRLWGAELTAAPACYECRFEEAGYLELCWEGELGKLTSLVIKPKLLRYERSPIAIHQLITVAERWLKKQGCREVSNKTETYNDIFAIRGYQNGRKVLP